MMKYLLLPVALLIMWSLLNDSISPGQMLLGGALAIFFTWAAGSLRPKRAYPKKALTALGLAGRVFYDVARSNVAVFRIIWRPTRGKITSGFMTIPLSMKDPHGLAVLACILSYTPGSVWVGLSPENVLTLHVLDLKDESEWVHLVHTRYEAPLKEIFE